MSDAINPHVHDRSIQAVGDEVGYDPARIADMQAEMQRLMRDYPDGNIPPEKIAEWEAMAQAEKEQTGSMALNNKPATKRRGRPRKQTVDALMPHDTPPQEVAEEAPDERVKLSKSDSKLAQEIARLYATIGLVVSQFNQVDGILLLTTAEDRAKELVAVASHHPQMKKALRQLTKSNDYVVFATGHGGLILALMQNHGIIARDVGRRVIHLFQRRPVSETAG